MRSLAKSSTRETQRASLSLIGEQHRSHPLVSPTRPLSSPRRRTTSALSLSPIDDAQTSAPLFATPDSSCIRRRSLLAHPGPEHVSLSLEHEHTIHPGRPIVRSFEETTQGLSRSRSRSSRRGGEWKRWAAHVLLFLSPFQTQKIA